MNQTLGLAMAPGLAMRATPALVSFAQLLALPVADLEAVVDRELGENPALDRVERRACPGCGQPVDGDRCRICAVGRPAAGPAEGVDHAALDAMQLVAERPTEGDLLLREVSLVLGGADRTIAHYVIADLDQRGLLDRDVSELARDLGVEATRVAEVIDAIRSVGPPGVCARDARECLLLQVDHWDRLGRAPALLRSLVADHLDDLAAGRLSAIARALDATQDEVRLARDFLRANLRPFVTFSNPPDQGVRPPVPDIIVRAGADDPDVYEVEVVNHFGLRLDPVFARIAVQSSAPPGLVTGEERREIADQVRRARLFLASLGDRSATLRTVAAHVVSRQRAFVRYGPGHHVPLTRADVAGDLGLHESTVSRAVRDKLVQLPSGRVVPFRDFFGAARSVHDCLRAIVAAEARPLSDTELARALGARGHRVARRTVAKYRAELGIARRPVR